MLSRTADHLFWMSRYTERAENTARILDVNYQTSLLPQSATSAQAGWEGLLSISELKPTFTAKYGENVIPRDVMDFMVRDEKNSSSIVSCLKNARENARAVRGTLTTEVWETENQTHLEVIRMLKSGDFERDPARCGRRDRDIEAWARAGSHRDSRERCRQSDRIRGTHRGGAGQYRQSYDRRREHESRRPPTNLPSHRHKPPPLWGFPTMLRRRRFRPGPRAV